MYCKKCGNKREDSAEYCGKCGYPLPDWQVFDYLFSAHSAVTDGYYTEFDKLIEKWDSELAEFGNDPTRTDWSRFRPLRLSREEDWSDWLAYLIERSDKGVFAQSLLGITGKKQAVFCFADQFNPNQHAT